MKRLTSRYEMLRSGLPETNSENAPTPLARRLAEGLVEQALAGDIGSIKLMGRASDNFRAKGLGDVVDRYEARRRKKMN